MNSTQIFKTCSKCGVEKPLTDFYKDKTSKSGYRYSCKKCSYTCNSKLKSSVGGYKICSKCNTEKPLDSFDNQKSGFLGKKSSCKGCYVKYYKQNKVVIDLKRREWLDKNQTHIKEYKKRYRLNNVGKIKTWKVNNKDKVKLNYVKNIHINSWRRILRRHLNYVGKDKVGSTIDMLGYPPEKLKQRIEYQFKSGMSWDNYGEWHIDHKKPLSRFDEDTSPKTVNSLCNLQPLWAIDNLTKSNKF